MDSPLILSFAPLIFGAVASSAFLGPPLMHRRIPSFVGLGGLALASAGESAPDESTGTVTEDPPLSFPRSTLVSHHSAVKTRSMDMALAFYSLLGFTPEAKFRAGPARAAWLTNSPPSDGTAAGRVAARIEIIEVPTDVLDEAEGTRKRAIDRMAHPALLGLDHVCLDVSASIEMARSGMDVPSEEGSKAVARGGYGLSDWVEDLQNASLEKFGKTLRIALAPRVKQIGRDVIEMAYIYDADGSLLELINREVNGFEGMEGEETSWDDEDDGIIWRVN